MAREQKSYDQGWERIFRSGTAVKIRSCNLDRYKELVTDVANNSDNPYYRFMASGGLRQYGKRIDYCITSVMIMTQPMYEMLIAHECTPILTIWTPTGEPQACVISLKSTTTVISRSTSKTKFAPIIVACDCTDFCMSIPDWDTDCYDFDDKKWKEWIGETVKVNFQPSTGITDPVSTELITIR